MKLLSLILLCLSLEWPASASTETYRIMAAHAEMSGMLATGLEAFRKDCGRYPTTAEGWAASIRCPTNLAVEGWHGPYLKTIPLDPWGKAYVYTCPGLHQTNGYDIFSCGPDAKAGTADDQSTWDGYIPPTDSPYLGLGYALEYSGSARFDFFGPGRFGCRDRMVERTAKPGQYPAAGPA